MCVCDFLVLVYDRSHSTRCCIAIIVFIDFLFRTESESETC